MQVPSQGDIDTLDRIASHYHCELLLPPVNNSKNIFIALRHGADLENISLALLYEGFSFLCKTINNKSYYEILGAHHKWTGNLDSSDGRI